MTKRFPTPFALVAVSLLGLAPTFLFFLWVAQNCQLPYLEPLLGLRQTSSWSPLAAAGFNLALFAAFAALHTVLAQREFPRLPYVAVAGVSLLVLIALWQPLRAPIWALVDPPWDRPINLAVMLVLLCGLVALTGSQNSLEFVGLRPVTAGLQTTGIYAIVRHPMHVVILTLFWAGPVMNLDRLLIALAATIYVCVAVPFEERRLLRRFGPAYSEYRQQVPAIFPWWRPRRPFPPPQPAQASDPAAPDIGKR